MPENKDLLFLVPKSKRQLLALYLEFWNLGWRHFLSAARDKNVKQQQVRFIERAMRCSFPLSQNILARLQKAFIAENLSLYLLLDLLPVWRYLATDKQPSSEDQLSEIINIGVSPVARLIMVLNNESPSTYLPMQALLSAILWEKLWRENSPLIKKIHLSKRQKDSKWQGQLKSAEILLAIVQQKILKWRLALFLNRVAIYKCRIENNKQVHPTVLDEIKIILYSIYQFITVRHRTMTQKGI